MLNNQTGQFGQLETTCGSLLMELQRIWDEVGDSDVERNKMILEIEQECLVVYGRKVDDAKISRAQLQQAIALSEAEIADLCSSLGEQPVHCDWTVGENLKEKLKAITPQLEDMRQRKIERKSQFAQVLNQLQKISNDIYGHGNMCKIVENETDLSVKRLEELHNQLADLQKAKSNRLRQVMDYLNNLNSLCMVLGVDFKDTISKIHPTLGDSKSTKDVSDNTIEKLATMIKSLQEVKIQRMEKLQYLATSLLELWNLMDTSLEERQLFRNVTSKIGSLEPEITESNLLSLSNIKYVEGEVSRLEQLKSSKMKELVLKKRLELEEICRKTHMVTETLSRFSIEAIESGSVDPVHLLEQAEVQIAKLREEAFSRKEILDKVEKWFSACEEEYWLEEYNRDDNRYNAGRGSHLTLRRAERARALVNKIPAILDALTSKVKAWEKERGIEFSYDGGRLLSMLDEYSIYRQKKEQERLRQRDQRRLQGQLVVEQEAIHGSRASPSKNGKKAPKNSTVSSSNRKLSLSGVMFQNSKPEKAAPGVHSNKKVESLQQNNPSSHQKSVGFAAHSDRRNSEIPGNVANKRSSVAAKVGEVEPLLVRKALSPVPFTISSKANIAKSVEDHERTQIETLPKALPGNNKLMMMTPSESIIAGNVENTTPMTMPIPMPITPSTLTVPMLMAMTPATPCVSLGTKAFEKMVETDEFSFEEIRVSGISYLQ